MGSLTRKAAIVGVNESKLRKTTDVSSMQIEAECARAALDDAGLTLADVDGYFGVTAPVENMSGIAMADYLNINPKIIVDTNIGGASYIYHVLQAASFIDHGLMDVALITYSQVNSRRRMRSPTGQHRQERVSRAPWFTGAFDTVYGLETISGYAQVASRHMNQFGTTSEQLAKIAVDTRYNASFNPEAMYRDRMGIEDVLNSRLVAWPLHLLDCCVVSDSGGAVVVASPQRARDCKQPPVWYLGGGMSEGHRSAGYRDYAVQGAARSGPRAFEMAGVSHDDIDLAMLYDSFTITVLTTIEDLGFCKIGEGGPFVESHKTTWDGDWPLNTDGGGLSSNHPGARGIFLLIEATRQLRGNVPDRQVKDCKIAICHGTGGNLGSLHGSATAILAKD